MKKIFSLLLITLVFLLFANFDVVNANTKSDRENVVINNKGVEINGYKVFGKYKMDLLEKKQDKYKYLSNYEILTYINNDYILKLLNTKNKNTYIIYDYEFNEINGFEKYGEFNMYVMKELKKKYKYVSNYDIVENFWLKDIINEINEINKKEFKVLNYDDVEINGFKHFGELKMSMLSEYKKLYPYVSNYDLLVNMGFSDILTMINDMNKK